jgi:hypothetical protein
VNAIDLFDDELFFSLFARFPLVLVYFAAILAAIVGWRRHSRASAFAISGAVILLFAESFEFFWELLLLDFVEVDEMIDVIDIAVVWGRPLVQAFGMALLVAAIFVGRRAPATGRLDDEIP